MKHYPAEFKADAVTLYQSRPGATIRSVAADLGVNPETPSEPSTPLEEENAALRKKIRELEEEREILRKAAKYFVGETR